MKFSIMICIFAWIVQCLFLCKQISSSFNSNIFMCWSYVPFFGLCGTFSSRYRMAIKVCCNCKSIISSLISSTSLYASTHLGLKLVDKELYVLVLLHLHRWFFGCIICYVMVSSLVQSSRSGSV